MRIELRLAPKPHTTRLGSLATFTRASPDQLTLELGQAGEHREHEAAVGRGRVRPGIVEGTEAGSLLGNSCERVQQITGRASQPIQAGDEHDVSRCEGTHEEGALGGVWPGGAWI